MKPCASPRFLCYTLRIWGNNSRENILSVRGVAYSPDSMLLSISSETGFTIKSDTVAMTLALT